MIRTDQSLVVYLDHWMVQKMPLAKAKEFVRSFLLIILLL